MRKLIVVFSILVSAASARAEAADIFLLSEYLSASAASSGCYTPTDYVNPIGPSVCFSNKETYGGRVTGLPDVDVSAMTGPFSADIAIDAGYLTVRALGTLGPFNAFCPVEPCVWTNGSAIASYSYFARFVVGANDIVLSGGYNRAGVGLASADGLPVAMNIRSAIGTITLFDAILLAGHEYTISASGTSANVVVPVQPGVFPEVGFSVDFREAVFVPEPGTLGLLALAFAGMLAGRRARSIRT